MQNLICELEKTAYDIRKDLIRLQQRADSPICIDGDLSSTDILTALFFKEMTLNPRDMKKLDRDRFVLSRAQATAAMYIVMAKRGFFDLQEIMDTYGKVNSRFGANPCASYFSCIEASTGSFGHGLPIAIGMALSARMNKQNHRIYTLIDRNECREGCIWEAADTAVGYALGNLIVLMECNMENEKSLLDCENQMTKWKAFGWNILEIKDGHDFKQILESFKKIPTVKGNVPTMILVHTVSGKGKELFL